MTKTEHIPPPLPEIVGVSAAMQSVYRMVKLVAPANATVLLVGETGTGKEVIAMESRKKENRVDSVYHPGSPAVYFPSPEDINALIEKAWGKVRKTPDELNKLIDKTRVSLSTSPGSFAAGKKVFENQCAKCHKFDGKGAEVGPALDGAGRDIEYLLANVLDPNRVVGAPYFVRTANLMDGQSVQGLLHAEDDQSVTLKTENGVLKRIARKDLDGEVKVAEKSMMPEGLTGGMTEQDFRDLIRYVMAHPYLSDVTVDGKKLAVPVTGQIALPEAKDTNDVEVVAEVTAADELKTQLQLAGANVSRFDIKLDGKVVTVDGEAAPNGVAVPVTLSKGKHTLSVMVHYKGTKAWASARFLDPDRKLSSGDGK